ncbi:aspartate/glutamate racemase family protein [Vibrio marisflavi]|uniref:Hydantoin racemase n=1 Tax=Vibrio marisflavi CECT 7928 TaxID=634439 RepID=A0ABN8E4C9_9VIBR|nr:aspartate/glutamate racemase family protein [Vibrio marisflavi]CAH0539580.1 Hydantoin racemase [Vibrio marisflavi CECT 7928]
MLIQIINPNTSKEITQKLATLAEHTKSKQTKVIVRSPQHGPRSIECFVDEQIASASLLDLVIQGESENVDAHIVACFSDPALYAAREVSSAPVIGIAEASFKFASTISAKFGIVTMLTRAIPMIQGLLFKYGYEKYCTNVRSAEIPVLDLNNISNQDYQSLYQECGKSISQDGAEAIVLGCAGMSELAQELSQQLGVPVIDGVSAAIKHAESLVQLGLSTSKSGQFSTPLSKEFIGRYNHLSSS